MRTNAIRTALLSVLLSSATNLQAQEWQWTQGFGSAQESPWLSDRAYGLATDAGGDVLVTGRFNNLLPIGQSPLVAQGAQDMFVAKLDQDGTPQWARRAGSALGAGGYAAGRAVAADASGNVFVTGYFSGLAVFGTVSSTDDPSLHNAMTLASEGSRDIFLAKYDSAGKLLWVKRAGGPDTDDALALALDPSGNPHIAGYIGQGVADFGPNHAAIGTAPDYAQTFYVASYGSATGETLWVAQVMHGDSSAHSAGRGLAIDRAGNIYVAGHFSRQTGFGPNLVLDSAQQDTENVDAFLAKYNSAGQALWVRQTVQADFGHDGTELYQAIAVDARANVYVAGYIQSPVHIGGVYLSPASGTDMVLAKYDSAGGVEWAHSAPSALPYALAFSPRRGLLVAGCFAGYSHLPAKDDPIEFSQPGEHVFAARLNPATGLGEWGLKTTGDNKVFPYDDCAQGIAASPDGDAVYVSGYFHKSAGFGDLQPVLVAKDAGHATADLFIAKVAEPAP